MRDKMFKRVSMVLIVLIIVYLLILIFPFVEKSLKFLYSICMPFFISFLFAYMLNPLVELVCKLKIKRCFSIILVLIIVIGLFTLLISSFLPLFINQIQDFVNKIPILIDDIDTLLKNIGRSFNFLPESMQLSMDNIIHYLEQNSDKIGEFIKHNILELYKKLTILILIPVLTIYFLIDFNNIKNRIKESLKKNKFEKLYSFLSDLNLAFLNYFKGLLIVVILLTIMCSIAFLVIKLDYSLLFALIIGMSDIIPYIGPYIGGGIVCIYALTISKQMFFTVLIIVIVIQLIESNILTPFIQSKKNKQKPILIIFSFLIFGKIFGFTGMILAVPITSGITLVYKYFIKDKIMKYVKD